MDHITFRTEFSEEMLNKINRVILKRRMRVILPLCLVVTLMGVWLLVMNRISDSVDSSFAWVAILWGLFFTVFYLFIMPVLWKKNTAKAMARMRNRVDTVDLYGTVVLIHSESDSGSFDQKCTYESFSGVYETDGYFLVLNGRAIALALDKNSVTESEREDARQMLLASFPGKKYKLIK